MLFNCTREKFGIADLSYEIFVERRASHDAQQKLHSRIKQRQKFQHGFETK